MFFMRPSFTRILNYLGLTIAFTAFVVIMIQVDYETSFCSSYANKERTYRVERGYINQSEQKVTGGYYCVFSRPMIEVLKDVPEVESYSRILGGGGMSFNIQDADNASYPAVKGRGNMISNKAAIEMMNIEIVCGQEQFDNMDKDFHTAFLSEDIVAKLYGNENPIGKRVIHTNQWSTDTVYIGGVFKAMSQNGIMQSDIIMPYGDFDLQRHNDQSTHFFVTLYEGIEKEEAERSLSEASKKYTDSSENAPIIRLTSIEDIHFTNDVSYNLVERGTKSGVFTLITVAIILLLVAMVNFWNIAMASVPSRIKSINTHKVLGASREELIAKQMLETVILAVASFLSAILLLWLLKDTHIAELVSDDINPFKHLGFISIVGIVALFFSALVGLSPALYSTSFAPALVLKGGFSHNVKGRKLRNLLIGFQFVVSLILGIFALFVNEQNSYMLSSDMGFKSGDVLYSVLDNRLAPVHKTLAERLKKHSEIEDVTFTSRDFVSIGGISMGWGSQYKGQDIDFKCLPVERNFIEFFNINILEGRHFVENDESTSNAHFIFNQTAARYYDIEVGTNIGGYFMDDDIVGVCEDFHVRSLQYGVGPIALVFYRDWNSPYGITENMVHCYIKRAHGVALNKVFDILKEEILALSSSIPQELITLNYYDETIGALYDKERRLSFLTLMSCVISVLIAIIGILGLVQFEMQYRKKEIAIRRVMGGSTTILLTMFNGAYIRICLICFLIAAPVAFFAIKVWLENYANQSPIPVWIFISALSVLLFIVVSTISLTSLRTINKNPVESIKTE